MPDSKDRERIVVAWLKSIQEDASKLFLVGDVFDYWFEYKEVIPKGFTRFFGALADLADAGVEMHFFKGNHDMWVVRYFQEEFGIIVHDHTEVFNLGGKKFFVGHGDGLGVGDVQYKLIKGLLRNGVSTKIFSLLHPDLGIRMMKYFSQKSRHSGNDEAMTHPTLERQIMFSEEIIKTQDVDYFVFGHRHVPIEHLLSNGRTIYFNLGEWWKSYSYLQYSDQTATLKSFSY